jgi:biopolymer transport protein ExbB
MLYFVFKGGPVMIPIILGSVLGLAIIIEKFWHLSSIKMDMEKFSHAVFSDLRSQKAKKALEMCKDNENYPLANIFKTAIENKDLPLLELERVIERAGNSEVVKLEKYFNGLVSVINIEPLLGFLGTITGLIRAFMAWEKAGANISVSVLASGIYEAMITTAAGLIIAIPYFLIYNYFVSRIKSISFQLNDYSSQLLLVLSEISGRDK